MILFFLPKNNKNSPKPHEYLRLKHIHSHLLYKSDAKIYILFFRKGTIFLDMEGTSLEAIVDVLLENMINNDSITYDMRKSKYNYNRTFKKLLNC